MKSLFCACFEESCVSSKPVQGFNQILARPPREQRFETRLRVCMRILLNEMERAHAVYAVC